MKASKYSKAAEDSGDDTHDIELEDHEGQSNLETSAPSPKFDIDPMKAYCKTCC